MLSQQEWEALGLIAYLLLDSGPIRRHGGPQHAELPPRPQVFVVAVCSSCSGTIFRSHRQCYRRSGLVQGEGVHGQRPVSWAMPVQQVRVHCRLL